jgi:hypothetical protein
MATTKKKPITMNDLMHWNDGETVCPPCLVGDGDGLNEWNVATLSAVVAGRPIPHPEEYVSEDSGNAAEARIKVMDTMGNVRYIYKSGDNWCCTSAGGAPLSFHYAGVDDEMAFIFALKDCKTAKQVFAVARTAIHNPQYDVELY